MTEEKCSNSVQVSYFEGEYKDDCLEGLARILWKDGTWSEGFFKGGVLHGFARRFDADKQLTFIGMYRLAELVVRGFRLYFGSVPPPLLYFSNAFVIWVYLQKFLAIYL